MKERTRIVDLRKRILNISLHINTIPEKNLLATYGNAKKSWDTSQLSLRLSAAIYWRFDLAPGQTALNYSGYVDYKGPALSALPLERTALFQAEYKRQSALHVQQKKARKKQAAADRRERKSQKRREKNAAAAGGSK